MTDDVTGGKLLVTVQGIPSNRKERQISSDTIFLFRLIGKVFRKLARRMSSIFR